MHAACNPACKHRPDARWVRSAAWAAAGALALLLDANGAAAQMLVARCSLPPPALAMGLQALADHLSAFPLVSVWMALGCAPAAAEQRLRSLQRALPRLALMVLAMVPACLLAAWAAGRWQGATSVLAYALVMVFTGQLLFCAACRIFRRPRSLSPVPNQKGFAS